MRAELWSVVKYVVWSAEALYSVEGNTGRDGTVRLNRAPRRRRTQARTYVIHRDGTWEVFGAPRRVVAGTAEERREAGPKMNDPKKSDKGIVAAKPANKGAQATAESAEQRPMINGNPQGQSTGRTQSRATATQAAERIRQFVRREPQEKLTALLHHITPEALRVAYYALKREAAPGVDGMTWREYETGLEMRLHDLHRRVHTGAYRATPVRRVNIDKPDGGTRPLGVAALEDKTQIKRYGGGLGHRDSRIEEKSW